MKIIWTNNTNQTINLKQFLQSKKMGHRLISAINHGAGTFLINGQPVASSASLAPQASVTVMLNDEKEDPAVQVSDQPVTVVYEDASWLIVNKPADLSTIPGPTNQTDTLLNRVKGYLISQGEKNLRPHMITRLDRFTSGIVLIAKNRLAQSLINEQVEHHTMIKKYQALVGTSVTIQHGLIDAGIKRVAGQIARQIAQGGQKSQTEFWSLDSGQNWSLLEVMLHTGRTHQIRVHCAQFLAPIIGDELYGGDTTLMKRQALHAYYLQFYDPIAEQTRQFTVPIPEDMQTIITNKK